MKILYLLPNLLDPASTWPFSPPEFDALIAESEREGYRFLRRHGCGNLPVHLLNEHTRAPLELLEIPEPRVGLISDAGLPCIADPGAEIVFAARQRGIEVQAFPGPSSLILALMLSGLPGQAFTFHGYVPREGIRMAALSKGVTHLWIEAPYRSDRLLKELVAAAPSSSRLAVAWNLMGPGERVISRAVSAWHREPLPEIGKAPAVFLLHITISVATES